MLFMYNTIFNEVANVVARQHVVWTLDNEGEAYLSASLASLPRRRAVVCDICNGSGDTGKGVHIHGGVRRTDPCPCDGGVRYVEVQT